MGHEGYYQPLQTRQRPIADSMIEWSRATAVRVHAGQMYGEKSYFSGHLEVVVSLVREAWAPKPPPSLVVSAAYLHDTLEDTNLTVDEIDLISPHLAHVVQLLTKPEGSRSKTRDAYFAQIRRSTIAKHVKVADRLANVMNASDRHARMYLDERESFAKLERSNDSRPTKRLWAQLLDEYQRAESRIRT